MFLYEGRLLCRCSRSCDARCVAVRGHVTQVVTRKSSCRRCNCQFVIKLLEASTRSASVGSLPPSPNAVALGILQGAPLTLGPSNGIPAGPITR